MKASTPPKQVAADVLSPKMAKEIWSGNYDKVLPVSVQHFDLSAVLPAIFYMFRFGHRRGKGKFLDIFGPAEGTVPQRRRKTTVEAVAKTLAGDGDGDFQGFDGEAERAILGDLFLCFCLENRRYALGRGKQIQRITPTHYLAAWVDLPDTVVHLRYVPELITAMLANQAKNAHIKESGKAPKQTFFPVVGRSEGNLFADNLLLKAFGQGMSHGSVGDLTADKFEEDTPVGIDQLLTIRIAQRLQEPPKKIPGKDAGRISNQHPIAERAAREFSEDIRKFVREYAEVIPRQAFVEILEACMAVGLTTIFTSVVEIVLEWDRTGNVTPGHDQKPAEIFIDCSMGVDRRLRASAEESMDDLMRRAERLPVVLMILRLLDYRARHTRKIHQRAGKIPTRPYAREWLELLGNILHRRHSQAPRILNRLEDSTEELADEIEENCPEYGRAAERLRNHDVIPNPARRLAEGLTILQGTGVRKKLHQLIDSVLFVNRPNGLAAKRTTRRKVPGSSRTRQRPVRSLVFTDPVLEYLVHRHLLPSGSGSKPRPLSLKAFIERIGQRYGFRIDTPPPGMAISNDLLQKNRGYLEDRLRDLGLLIGVNDAEAMKRLKPRFRSENG